MGIILYYIKKKMNNLNILFILTVLATITLTQQDTAKKIDSQLDSWIKDPLDTYKAEDKYCPIIAPLYSDLFKEGLQNAFNANFVGSKPIEWDKASWHKKCMDDYTMNIIMAHRSIDIRGHNALIRCFEKNFNKMFDDAFNADPKNWKKFLQWEKRKRDFNALLKFGFEKCNCKDLMKECTRAKFGKQMKNQLEIWTWAFKAFKGEKVALLNLASTENYESYGSNGSDGSYGYFEMLAAAAAGVFVGAICSQLKNKKTYEQF